MGVGKTSIGLALAKKLNENFVDTDEAIEKSTGKSVSEIFLEDGEESFRILEAKALADGLKSAGILSLGGGACIPSKAQELIRASSGQVIFLDISLKEVSGRIGFDKARPLLAINPRSKWQNLMEARRPIYESLSDNTILVDGKSEEEIVEEILGAS